METCGIRPLNTWMDQFRWIWGNYKRVRMAKYLQGDYRQFQFTFKNFATLIHGPKWASEFSAHDMFKVDSCSLKFGPWKRRKREVYKALRFGLWKTKWRATIRFDKCIERQRITQTFFYFLFFLPFSPYLIEISYN